MTSVWRKRGTGGFNSIIFYVVLTEYLWGPKSKKKQEFLIESEQGEEGESVGQRRARVGPGGGGV